MSLQPSGVPYDGSAYDLLEMLGLPLDFGPAVLAADGSSACEERPSAAPIAGPADSRPPVNVPLSESSCPDPELFSRAYSCSGDGLLQPRVQVRPCGDGKGWGLFALSHFAASDVRRQHALPHINFVTLWPGTVYRNADVLRCRSRHRNLALQQLPPIIPSAAAAAPPRSALARRRAHQLQPGRQFLLRRLLQRVLPVRCCRCTCFST